MKMKGLLLVDLLPAASSADEVHLKGGGHVSGRIVQRTATIVEVDVGAGKVTVPASRVERIEERTSGCWRRHPTIRMRTGRWGACSWRAGG
jgi:hypothetical protein